MVVLVNLCNSFKYNKVYFFAIIILSILFVQCADNFGDSIKEENTYKDRILPVPEIDPVPPTPPIPPVTGNDLWEILDVTATNRAGAAMVEYEGWIYIYGGEDFSGIRSDFWRYEISTGNFEILSSDNPKAYSSLVEIDGVLYLFAGKTIDYYENVILTNQLKHYNIVTDTWTEITVSDTNGSWPDARYSHVLLSYTNSSSENFMIVHGGYDDSENVYEKVYKLNLSPLPGKKPTWTKDDVNLFSRADHAASIINDKIYFFGGYDSGYKKDVNSYDLISETFDLVNNSATLSAKSAIKMIVIDNNLLIYGGKDGTNIYNDLWAFSLDTNSWLKLKDGPGKRCYYSAIKYNNNMIIFGGYYLNSLDKKIFNSELWEYDIDISD